MKKNGFIWFLLIVMLLTMVLSIYKSNYDERKRTKDYKTVEEWAVEIAKENFFYIRESDEVYLYTIEEVYVGNFDYEGDDFGKYFRAFKIVMMNDGGYSETYLVSITYNGDNHFKTIFKRFFGLIKEERFGKEHIVWADCDEI